MSIIRKSNKWNITDFFSLVNIIYIGTYIPYRLDVVNGTKRPI